MKPEGEGARIANRAIQYRGQLAGIAVAGLLETFAVPPPRRSLGDWLDHNDYGYPAGLVLGLASGVGLLFAGFWSLWWLVPAAALYLVALALCWWFG